MTEYARTIDAWISSYETTEEQLIADSFSQTVADALITRFNSKST
jgi:hypothetical protein